MNKQTSLLAGSLPVDPFPVTEPGVRFTAVGLRMVHRNGTTALDDINLTIEPGHLPAVVGPSGAGKTTLLSALAGTASLQWGRVLVSGSGPLGSDATLG